MSGKVANIISEGATVAFVLESPHVEEVFHGYPACGPTGREMSRVLLGRYDIPLGLIAKHPDLCGIVGLPRLNPFSVMNVCCEPLQEEAYSENGINPPSDLSEKAKLKKYIEKGDANLETQHRDPNLRAFRDALYTAFKVDPGGPLARHHIVVPCGLFARVFVEHLKEQLQLGFDVIGGISHPALNDGWSGWDQTSLQRVRGGMGLLP